MIYLSTKLPNQLMTQYLRRLQVPHEQVDVFNSLSIFTTRSELVNLSIWENFNLFLWSCGFFYLNILWQRTDFKSLDVFSLNLCKIFVLFRKVWEIYRAFFSFHSSHCNGNAFLNSRSFLKIRYTFLTGLILFGMDGHFGSFSKNHR